VKEENQAMIEIERLRDTMIEFHLKARGIDDPAVLKAMRDIPREAFVPDHLSEFAYEDAPLPIGEGQTISQPFIVALMTQLLELSGRERVLEIGTGSGYAAAVLSRMVEQVYTVERHEALIAPARERFERLGLRNIRIHGDGTLGLPEHVPYDAIVVTAGAPHVPEPLKNQLAVGGRLVIPVEADSRAQSLIRVRRTGEDDYSREEMGAVRFVPLIGAAGWKPDEGDERPIRGMQPKPYAEVIAQHGDIISSIGETDLQPLLDRIGDARVVLLGEATHGTAEFYDMRARITRELITRKGFNMVAFEADWPDMAQVDRYINGKTADVPVQAPFTRFPTWMWANVQFSEMVEWTRRHNLESGYGRQAGSFLWVGSLQHVQLHR
jgi:protein-L-isoaspartate(D-aspartate) O-methyltransferase